MPKPIHFLGSSLQDLRQFPATARREVGYQLERVQHGLDPSDWKPIKVIGRGVREIRVQQEGQYRVIYIANFADTTYVLHAFRKKTRKISNQDLDVARQRLQQVQEKRKWSR